MSDNWDNYGAWDDGSERPTRTGGGRGCLVSLVLVIIVVAAGAFVFFRERQGPDYAARAWLEAVVQMDSDAALSLTCRDVPANGRLTGQAGGMLVSFLQDNGGSLDALGLNLDIGGLVEYLQFETTEIVYESTQLDDDRAVVQVRGPLVVRYRVISLPLMLDEQWQMVRENGRWKWCGR